MTKQFILALMLMGCLLFGCDDSSTGHGDLKFSGITATDGTGVLYSFDPDDWCYGPIVMNDELVFFMPQVFLYAMDTGTTVQASVMVFNYSDDDVVIQLNSNDSAIIFQMRSVIVSGNSWGEIPMLYRAYTYAPYYGELALPVDPQGDTFYLPFVGYAGIIIGPPESLPLGFFNSYPNPCTHSTTLRFSMPEAAHVRLVVRGPNYYLAGGRTLLDEDMPAGWHEVAWDLGATPDTGIYRAYIEIDDFQCYGDIRVVDDVINWESGSR